MSVHTEWCSAIYASPDMVSVGGYEDEWGQTNDKPCLLLGSDSVFAIEGTVEEIREMLQEALYALNVFESTMSLNRE